VTTNSRALLLGCRITLAVCVPLSLLLSNLHVVASPTYIRSEYGKPAFPLASTYSGDERLALAEATLYYMRSGEDAGYLAELQTRGRPIYNAREVRHLIDAKRILRGAFWVQAICTLISLLAFFLDWRANGRPAGALRAVSRGCLALFLLLTSIGLLAYFNFNLFFTAFHRIFFEGDSWLFSRTDSLIQLFPIPFWTDATFLISTLSLLELVVVSLAAHALSSRLGGTE
jgi:integral membrane protein (TIGR01906 family)